MAATTAAVLELDDVRLWRAVAEGRSDAVRELIDVHLPVVWGFVVGRVAGQPELAEDILQETLLEAVRRAPTYRGEAALATWLCAIARSKLYHHWGRERRAEAAAGGIAVLGGTTGDVEEVVARRDLVLKGLAALSAVHRQVLVMKYLDDQSVEAIAAHLGRPVVQVQSLLQRARAGFRRMVPDGGL